MIKAIETSYKGYRFRSRLEARWAVFFDALGVVWEYEKQGYDLGVRRYLPDFWLPIPEHQYRDAGYWVEIKPIEPDEDELDSLLLLTQQTGHNGFLLAGSMGIGEYRTYKTCCIRSMDALEYWISQASRLVTMGDGPRIMNVTGQFHPDDYAACLIERDDQREFGLPFAELFVLMSNCASDFRTAYAVARSARFEHGEKPVFSQ